MKKRKILRGWLTAVFLAALVISCSNSNNPEKPAEEKNPSKVEPEKVDTKTINGKSYDIVTFGHYPQTKKDDSVTINKEEIKPDEELTYYKGSDGQWYFEWEYDAGFIDFYKMEPIEWRILTDDYDHDNDPSTPGAKLLLAEKVLDNEFFYNSMDTNRTIENETIYPNDYKHSAIRAYLNGLTYVVTETENNCFYNAGFLQLAFTADEQKKIQKTGATEDKLFLLSIEEVSNADYGFTDNASRIKNTTDLANPTYDENEECHWWLRSATVDNPTYHDAADLVDNNGSLTCMGVNGCSIWTNYWGGVVPALCIF